MKANFKNRISKLLIFTGSIIFFIHILSFFGKYNWILDVFSHFKLQYFIILSFLLISSILIKNKKNIISISIYTIFIGLEVFSIFFGGNKDTKITEYFKVLSINLLTSNTHYTEASNYIAEQQPDILILLESSEIWLDNLNEVTKQYDYKQELPKNDNFGIAIYSKFKLDSISVFYERKLGSSISAFFEFKNKKIKILAIHPKPPIGKLNFEFRNNFFNNIIENETNRNYELIVIGDFNLSSYSANFKNFTNQLDLIDSRKEFGFQHSWHLIPILTISTIDHCLISENLKIKNREIGKDIGSDHKPIYVEIGF